MKRIAIISCALLFVCGCASDSDKAKWADCWKDLRGDNMQMQSNFGGTEVKDNHQSQLSER
jgi:hypothetical protein